MIKRLLLICLGLIVGYALSYLQTPKTISQTSPIVESQAETRMPNLELEFAYTKQSVSLDEEKLIKATISNFENYQANKDGKAVLAMFTPPSNDKEQQEYNFLTGKDLIQPTSMRMYGTAVLDFQLDWYYITDITKNGNAYIVQVIESRTARDNTTPDYFVSSNDLVFELVESSPNELKVDKYRGKVSIETESRLTKKYDGFY